jgi:hypothetical protein
MMKSSGFEPGELLRRFRQELFRTPLSALQKGRAIRWILSSNQSSVFLPSCSFRPPNNGESTYFRKTGTVRRRPVSLSRHSLSLPEMAESGHCFYIDISIAVAKMTLLSQRRTGVSNDCEKIL